MKKSYLVILDANVVIDAYQNNYWNTLVTAYNVYLPAIVLRDEVQYFRDRDGKKFIDLSPYILKGTVVELEATLEEEAVLQASVKPVFLPKLDPGEREALALLKSPRCKNFLFCTGDALAIQGLSILGMTPQGISVEKLLNNAGSTKKVKPEFTEKRFQAHLVQGFQEREFWIIK